MGAWGAASRESSHRGEERSQGDCNQCSVHRLPALGNRVGVQRLDTTSELGEGDGGAGKRQSFSPGLEVRCDLKIMLDLEREKEFRVLA